MDTALVKYIQQCVRFSYELNTRVDGIYKVYLTALIRRVDALLFVANGIKKRFITASNGRLFYNNKNLTKIDEAVLEGLKNIVTENIDVNNDAFLQQILTGFLKFVPIIDSILKDHEVEVLMPNNSLLQTFVMPKLFKKVDGVILLSNNWNFHEFSPSTVNINVRSIFTRRNSTTKLLKGTRFVKSKYVWKVHLFNKVSIIIWTTSEKFLDYGKITKICKLSLVEAIEKDKTTDSYHKYLNYKSVGLEQIDLQPGDYSYIGNVFSKIFLKNLTAFIPRRMFNWAFCHMEMGQSLCVDEAMNLLLCLKKQGNLETLIHYAYDYQRFGYAIGWKKFVLMEKFGQPNYEFYPMALNGVGNFFYDMVKNKGPNSNNFLVETPIRATYLKFYNSFGKHVHTHPNKPFTKPEIATFLWKVATMSHTTHDFQTKKIISSMYKKVCGDVQVLKNLLSNQEVQNVARFEIIVSDLSKTYDVSAHAQTAEDLVCNSNNILRKSFVYFNKDLLNSWISHYLFPIVLHFEKHLQNYNYTTLATNTYFKFSLDDCVTSLAAECVSSFFVYGSQYKLASSNNISHVCYKIFKEIDLIHKSKGSRNKRPILQPLEDNNGIKFDQGFEFLNTNTVEEFLSPTFEVKFGLAYRDLLIDLQNNTHKISCRVYDIILQSCNLIQNPRHFNNLLSPFLDKKQEFQVCINTFSAKNTVEFINKISTQHQITTTKEFIFNLLFTNKYNLKAHGLILWAKGLLTEAFGTNDEAKSNFIVNINKHISDVLIEEGTLLYFPIPGEINIAVFPSVIQQDTCNTVKINKLLSKSFLDLFAFESKSAVSLISTKIVKNEVTSYSLVSIYQYIDSLNVHNYNAEVLIEILRCLFPN